MSKNRKKNNEESQQVTINTTFTGVHAKLILDYQQKFQCNKPTALRFILNHLAAGLLVTLDTQQKNKIERLVSHPILKERHGFGDTKSFVEWAINNAVAYLTQELGKLSDPNVQMMFGASERAVARQLLLMSRDVDYYGGVTLDQLYIELKIDRDLIRRILDDFIQNGWIVCLKEMGQPDRYLPKE